MRIVSYDYVSPQLRDRLAGFDEDFELITRSDVRKVCGFQKSLVGTKDGYNHYLFTKSIQMSTKSVHRPGGML